MHPSRRIIPLIAVLIAGFLTIPIAEGQTLDLKKLGDQKQFKDFIDRLQTKPLGNIDKLNQRLDVCVQNPSFPLCLSDQSVGQRIDACDINPDLPQCALKGT